MTTKELIRAEIERRINDNTFGAKMELIDILSFLDTLPDEPVSNDLKEAAEEYRQGEVDSGCDYIDDSDGDSLYHSACLTDAFKAEAEWQKRKMMEVAVEGEVVILPRHVSYVMEKNNESLKQYLLDNFKAGDKVKIIIGKEDAE